MIELYRQGKVRAIGVSNFKPHHLSGLMKTEIPPMVDQIEYHPGMLQAEAVAYCRENNILVEGWIPLGTGRMLQNESLIRLAARYENPPLSCVSAGLSSRAYSRFPNP